MSDMEHVSVALLGLRGSTAALVEEACALAGVQARPFDGDTPLPEPAPLVIAELRAGDRRVPQRVLDAVTSAGGRSRLLLLCGEALVRPHVTTQRGRVVIVSPPHSAGRLSNRIRVLLADVHSKPNGGPLHRREHYTERWWLCSFESASAEPTVLVQHTDAGGMTAVLFPPGSGARDAVLGRVVELLARERSDEARGTGLAQVAGSCAVVHLSAACDRWLFHWPSPTWPMGIYSPQRLPARAVIGARASNQRAWSMIAAPGDLVLACSGPLVEADRARIDLWGTLEEGGPAAVDLLDGSTELARAVRGGVAVEVL
jgi:hypothetical protein